MITKYPYVCGGCKAERLVSLTGMWVHWFYCVNGGGSA